jgi:TetR/AcrR family transcriptional regulator, transcriptional repressor for nem operon
MCDWVFTGQVKAENFVLDNIPTGWYFYAMNMSPHPTHTKILHAALDVMRQKGYAATSVDDICATAELTKGGFFHHFKSKEELAVAAARYWGEWTGAMFAAAPFNNYEDPLDQLVAYVDFRIELLKGRTLPEFTCYLGTTVQETYLTHPAIRDAVEASFAGHTEMIAKIAAAAKARHAPHASWTAESLALHTQAVIQGAFILAKAQGGPGTAAEQLRHLRRYIELLFQYAKEE